MESVLYKRATFATRLPVLYLYTQAHTWLAAQAQGAWRVGYTKFALRMLGELVDVQLEVAPGAAIQTGDVLGMIEGFKAISDVYAVGEGRFVSANPELHKGLERVGRDPYQAGWIYEFSGTPDSRTLDVEGYRALLDATIDRMLAKQKENSA
jgi:glycine cleavage system H protein